MNERFSDKRPTIGHAVSQMGSWNKERGRGVSCQEDKDYVIFVSSQGSGLSRQDRRLNVQDSWVFTPISEIIEACTNS